MIVEDAFCIPCEEERMVAIHTAIRERQGKSEFGIVIVVGGPQYRVGSHRQFVVAAREWARAGKDVLRFDFRGIGDSEGKDVGFENVGPDIRAAVDALVERVPGMTGVILFGLCDGASAALLYAPTDSRVKGLVLANPWVRSERTAARATLKHYYLRRLIQLPFWQKLLTGKLNVGRALAEMSSVVSTSSGSGGFGDVAANHAGFVARMITAWQAFRGEIALILSGQDLTAAEFLELCKRETAWKEALEGSNVTRYHLSDADHTFSQRAAMNLFIRCSLNWLERLRLRDPMTESGMR